MKPVDVPFFVAPYKDEAGGVDFLGLRQVNLDLMYEFLPGINNVTWYLRPYSVMTWFAWAFHQEMKRQGIEDFKRKDFKAFREKVELLFGWGHQIVGTKRGMVGSTSKPPNPSGIVPLSFEAWKRNVSWLDAVNYGPSLKMDNGLGLLVQVKPGVFAVTTRGEKLAEALDAQLQTCNGYRSLRSDADMATPAVAEGLHAGWNIEKSSARERSVLWSALYDESSVGKDDLIGRRSRAVQLIKIALGSTRRPLHAHEVRERLARGGSPKGRSLNVPAELTSHHHIWIGVQVRQAQRLGLEAMFAWLERQVLLHGLRDSHALAKQAVKAMKDSEYFAGMATPGDSIAELKRQAKKQGRPLWRGADEAPMDMFGVLYKLQDAIKADTADYSALAMHLLFLCAVLTEELAAEGVPSDILDRGDLSRVSLARWNRHVTQHAEKKFAPFMVNFLEIFMLSQHFGTATRRYEVGKQRLRVTIEERGLTPMITPDDLWKPAPAPDRLEAMLSLMADCGVIAESDDGYFLKDD